MRILPSIMLGAALVALAPLPAAAGGHRGGMHAHHRFVLHGLQFRGLNRFAFGRAGAFFPLGFGDGGMLGGGVAGVAQGAPEVIVLEQAPAPTPAPPRLADERPSIEKTTQGVTIIRGPGSHHLH